ncbi:MAG: hypothetical protein Q8O67_04895 [Deltaproteobacteria bacterium]|nr:hypothetical protein [Deltaproteobacteria bacterium]
MNDELHRLLAAAPALEVATGIKVVVIGGIARGNWAQPRTTDDVDVIVDTDRLQPFIDAAAKVGLVTVATEIRALALAEMTRLRLPEHPSGPVHLDVIAASHPFYGRVILRSTTVTMDGLTFRVASAEDIILLKLLADRPQDRADIAAIVDAQRGSLDLVVMRAEAAELGLDLPTSLG